MKNPSYILSMCLCLVCLGCNRPAEEDQFLNFGRYILTIEQFSAGEIIDVNEVSNVSIDGETDAPIGLPVIISFNDGENILRYYTTTEFEYWGLSNIDLTGLNPGEISILAIIHVDKRTLAKSQQLFAFIDEFKPGLE